MPATIIRNRKPRFPWMVAAALLFVSTAAAAAPVAFGNRTLQIPEPAGYQSIGKTAPQINRSIEAALPAFNRLVDVYVSPAAISALKEGRKPDLDRYMDMIVFRPLDGVPLALYDFDRSETQIASAMQAKVEMTTETLTPDRAAASSPGDAATQLAPLETPPPFKYLGAFRREPWGLFFSFQSHIASAEDPRGIDVVSAGAFVLADYQAIYLYGKARYRGYADRRWAEQAVSAWADAVHAANPDNPVVAMHAMPMHQDIGWLDRSRTWVIACVVGALSLLLGSVVGKRMARKRPAP